MQTFSPRLLLIATLLLWHSACQKKQTSSASSDSLFGSSTAEPVFDDSQNLSWETGKVLIENAKILTATGKSIEGGYLLLQDGKIAKLGAGQADPKLAEGAQRVDAKGKYVTPGIIDTHSHMGVYPFPEVKAHQDGNEAVEPVTAEVWAEHSFWPQDPALWRALASGVTTIQVLPGSANLIGGRSVTLHLRPSVSVSAMRFPGAPQGLKMACGENPKRVYGEKGGPATRMGNVAGYRKAFQEALEYQEEWDSYQKKKSDDSKPPKRDHRLDTIVKAMKGEILVHVHCYRADEMSLMLDLAKTYGFKIRSFHHALEAYKIRDRLAKEKVTISTWADWWGFKMEAFDGIPQNAPLLAAAGGMPIIHSDSPDDVRYLLLEAEKARRSAAALGLSFSDEEVLQWVTKNAAWALGIDAQVGTLEEGKMADLVVWDRHPFSIYAKAAKVYIRGTLVFDRQQGLVPASDLERGIRNYGLADRGSQKESSPGAGLPEATALKPLSETGGVASSSFVIEHARLETGLGTQLKDASIWIENGLIKAINPQAVPATLPRVDAGHRTLTPGLIETQSQIGTFVIEMEDSAHEQGLGEGFHPAYRSLDGFDAYAVHMAITRAEGVSTALSKPQKGAIAGQGHAFDLSMSPKALETPAPPVMFASVVKEKSRGKFWLDLRQAIDDARLYKGQGGKTTVLGHQLSLSPLHLEALWEVLQGRIPFVLEVHRVADIEAALRLKQELTTQKLPIRLILSGAGEAWLLAKDLAKEKIPIVLTPSRQLPANLDQLKVRDDQAALLAEAGVPLIISTDDVKASRLRQEAGRAVAYALPYAEALRAITSRPAEVFGLKDRGVIEVGKRADLALWSGDPLEPATRLERLWIRGQAQDLNHRQLELARAHPQ